MHLLLDPLKSWIHNNRIESVESNSTNLKRTYIVYKYLKQRVNK